MKNYLIPFCIFLFFFISKSQAQRVFEDIIYSYKYNSLNDKVVAEDRVYIYENGDIVLPFKRNNKTFEANFYERIKQQNNLKSNYDTLKSKINLKQGFYFLSYKNTLEVYDTLYNFLFKVDSCSGNYDVFNRNIWSKYSTKPIIDKGQPDLIFAIKINKHYAIFDRAGNMRTTAVYDTVLTYCNNAIWVKEKGYCQAIDINGNVLAKLSPEIKTYAIKQGILTVYNNDKKVETLYSGADIIYETNKKVRDLFNYRDEIYIISHENYSRPMAANDIGIEKIDGSVILPFEYNDIKYLGDYKNKFPTFYLQKHIPGAGFEYWYGRFFLGIDTFFPANNRAIIMSESRYFYHFEGNIYKAQQEGYRVEPLLYLPEEEIFTYVVKDSVDANMKTDRYTAVYDENFNKIIDWGLYKSITIFSRNAIRVDILNKKYNDSFYGVIDASGKTILPAIFSKILYISSDLFYCVIDEDAKQAKGEIKLNKLEGHFRNSKNEIVGPRNLKIYNVFPKLSIATYKNNTDGTYGIINDHLETIILPEKYKLLQAINGNWSEDIISCDLIPVSQKADDNKIGFIDKNGKEIIPFSYTGLFGSVGTVYKVAKNKEIGYLKNTGDFVTVSSNGNYSFTKLEITKSYWDSQKEKMCSTCKGNGYTGDCIKSHPCSWCGGSGSLSKTNNTCSKCGGAGKIEKVGYYYDVNGIIHNSGSSTYEKCSLCLGKGTLGSSFTNNCTKCNGDGYICDEFVKCKTCNGSGKVKN